MLAEATSEYLPAAQADLAKNLEICDLIKSRQVGAREAMRSLKRRLEHRNPNVQLLALELADATVKNTSPVFLRELVSREFISTVTTILGGVTSGIGGGPVVDRARELFQIWALLLGSQPGLGYIREAYEQCRREGVPFPATPPRHALVSSIVRTEAPPEWTDSAICERCAVPFGVLLRKHHCRRCGRTFCQDCSGKMVALPEMGLYEEVRVCEGCYATKFAEHTTSGERSLPRPPKASDGEGEDGEADDLARAIQLSLQERGGHQSPPRPSASSSSMPPSTQSAVIGRGRDTSPGLGGEYDEDAALAAAIAASLRESTAAEPPQSADEPVGATSKDAAPLPGTSRDPGTGAIRQPPLPSQPVLLVSPIERENVQLFSELISRMGPQDEELEEADFLKLARDMILLRDRLLEGISAAPLTPDIQRLLHTLDMALAQYERLALTIDHECHGGSIGGEEGQGGEEKGREREREQSSPTDQSGGHHNGGGAPSHPLTSSSLLPPHRRETAAYEYDFGPSQGTQVVYPSSPYRSHDLTTMPSRPRSHTGSIMVTAMTGSAGGGGGTGTLSKIQKQHHPHRQPNNDGAADDNDGGDGYGDEGEGEGEDRDEGVPAYMRPVPADIVPVLQPQLATGNHHNRRTSSAEGPTSSLATATAIAGDDAVAREAILIPLTSDLEEDQGPGRDKAESDQNGKMTKTREDPLAELTEDAPLIQL